MIDFGKRLRELRDARRLREEDVHAVSRGQVSRLETGARTHTLASIEKLCEAYGIGLHRIFTTDESFERQLMMEDAWLLEIAGMVKALTWPQRSEILRTLAAAPVQKPIRRRRRKYVPMKRKI